MALVDNAWYVNFGNGSSTGYYGVTAWAAAAAKVCGNLIRQAATPAVGSERVFVCIASTAGTGTTGGVEPTWTVTRGAKNTDNTVTWQEATGIAALNGDLTNTPAWSVVKNTAVTLGQVIKSGAGDKVLICTTAGTAGNAAEPTWSAFTNAGATTADNTVTWTTIAAVPSGFSNWAAPHARLGNACAANWGQAGNNFYTGDNHAETQASASTLTLPGTAANPCFIYCVNHLGSIPPVSADLRATASITTTGNSNLTLNVVGNVPAYCYGISFNCGTGANATILTVQNWVLDSCALAIIATASTTMRVSGAVLNNTTVSFGATAQNFAVNGGRVLWKNTPNAIVGATLPTTLILSTAIGGPVVLQGVDLSALGSGKTIVGALGQANDVYLIDCKLGASATVAATPGGQVLNRTFVIRSDSSGTNYIEQTYTYAGTQVDETTIVRTGGASDGTTAKSRKITTTANSRWLFPFESNPIAIWNDTTGSAKTVTIFGIWGGGAVPNNDDIWIEVEYLGSSATPQGSFANSTKSDGLAAGSALSSDGSTWGGSTTAFKMSVTITPQMKGPFNILVKAAKPSTTFYIDPLAVVT